MDQEKLGKFIEKLRKDKNWTQKDLGEKLGVSNGAVSKWECGNNLPDISMLEPLSKALDISVMNLLNCQEPSEEERELEKQNNIRKICFRNLKYLTCILCLILLISLCCLPLVINSVRNLSKKNKTEDDTVRVFELISEDENYTINGYVIFNKDENIVNINKITYQGISRGTDDIMYANNVRIILEIDGKSIYSITTDYEDKKLRELNEIIQDAQKYGIENQINEYNLFNFNHNFPNTIIKIECLNDKEPLNSFEIEVNLKEKFA